MLISVKTKLLPEQASRLDELNCLTDKNPKTSTFYECIIEDFPQSVESVFITCSTFFQKSLSFQIEIIIITMLPEENLSIHFSGKAAIVVCLGT